ncbi:antitoxin VapB family protein [Pyrococcus kukulkanii]|uniref:antitoxin VapB family protein n=1 Tax=Pyrococcus kukulkanii TaxID=1609559 RepID=UPI000943A0E7|nr:antitoxin VapB family protein [Pyrococcus kukulkanii]
MLQDKRKKGNFDVLMIAFGSMSEEEAKRFRKTLKEVEEWMNEWTPRSLRRSDS